MSFNLAKINSGIELGYARFGKSGGIPAFYFHGLPGSAAEGELLHAACLDNNIELIAVDRFGYGESSALQATEKKDRYTAWAEAINEFASQLCLEKYYIFAASGGGPYALACASLLHERVIATGIACGLGPVVNEDLREQMRPMATWAFYLARHHPFLLTLVYGTSVSIAARWMSGLTIDVLGRINLAVDRTALSQPAAHKIMQRNLTRAFLHGIQGAREDLIAAQQPWSFNLAQIKNLHLWHGASDRVVPKSHSQWVSAHVADSSLYILPGEGHFSLPILHANQIVETVCAGK